MLRQNKIALFLMLLPLAISARADVVSQAGVSLSRVLVDSENFSGCMVQFTNWNSPPGCKAKWISLDCDGNFVSKESGRRFLEIAQMAFALEKQLFVAVDTSQRTNGYCVAKRLDISN